MEAADKGEKSGSPETFGKLAVDGGEPVRKTPFGPRWLIGKEERSQIDDVMNRAHYDWRSGNKVREFSQAFAAVYGMHHGIPTTSGTGAIHTAIGALNPNPYDEIITTPVTDVGSILGILQHNLIPVFVDWDASRFNMDARDIESKITERTRAILVVHLFGNPCDMVAIMDIAERYRLPVIEDCAQALLAEFDGQKVGTFGAMACFSFGLKTLSTDQGGMLLTNENTLATYARGFVGKGNEKNGSSWTRCGRLGAFYPMTDLQAAIGIAQLEKLEAATQVREVAAAIWDDSLSSLEGFHIPERRRNERAVHYVYPFLIQPEVAGVSVADFVKALHAEGIRDAAGPYLEGIPLSRRPLFAEARTYGVSGIPIRDEAGMLRCDYRACRLPVIERMLPNLGFLHLRNSLSESDAEDVARAICKVAGHYRRRRGSVKTPTPTEPSFESLTTFGQQEATASADLQSQHDAPSSPAQTRTPSLRSSVLNILDFGAAGDGKANKAVTNDAAFAALLKQLRQTGGRVEIPRGVYYLTKPLRFNGVRNVHLTGDGAMLSKNCATRLVYIGDEVDGLIDLVTAVQCTFQGIGFESRSSKAGQILNIRAFETGPTAMSTLSVEFLHCGFRTQGDVSADASGVKMRDSAHITFRHCWFQTACPAVEMGAAPLPEQRTISNGQCNNIAFEHCLFFADVNGRHGSGFAFNSCQFSRKPNGAGARIDMTPAGTASVRNVSVIGCSAMDTAPESRGGIFFRQGHDGVGLTMLSSRIHFYDVAVLIDGKGAALVSGNVFRQITPGAADIRVEASASDLSISANDHSATRDAGNEAIVHSNRSTQFERLGVARHLRFDRHQPTPHATMAREAAVVEAIPPPAVRFGKVLPDRHFQRLAAGQWRYMHSSTPHRYWLAVFDVEGTTEQNLFVADVELRSNRSIRISVSLGRNGTLAYEGKHQHLVLKANEPQRVHLRHRFEQAHTALKVQLAVEAMDGIGEAVLTIESLSVQRCVDQDSLQLWLSEDSARAEGVIRQLYAALPALPPLTALDLGAGDGCHTVHLAEVATDSNVVAVEPDPTRCTKLRQRLKKSALSARVSVVESAAQRDQMAQTMTLRRQSAPTFGSLLSKWPPLSERTDHESTASILVSPATTVDAVCRSAGLTKLDLVRVGFSSGVYDAMLGALRTLNDYRPVVAFKAVDHGDDWDVGEAYWADLLASCDYRLLTFTGEQVEKVQVDGYPYHYAVPAERLNLLQPIVVGAVTALAPREITGSGDLLAQMPTT